MLMIRLQRVGKKKSPTYRLIVSEKTKDTQARSLEILGIYNPTESTKLVNLKEDRIKYWLSVGAQPSSTVNNLLINNSIISGEKKRSVTISKKRKAKMDGKKAEAEEKAATEKAAKEVEKPVDEPKVEEIVKAEKTEAPTEKESTEEKVEQKPEEKKEDPSTGLGQDEEKSGSDEDKKE